MKDPVISHAKHFSDADSKGKPKQKPCPAAKDRKLSLEGAILLVKVFRNLLQGKGIFVFFLYMALQRLWHREVGGGDPVRCCIGENTRSVPGRTREKLGRLRLEVSLG